jgi:hypothetical protein
MRKLMLIIILLFTLVGCEEIMQPTPYKHLKRGTDQLDSWNIIYDEINQGVSDELSNHDSDNKRIFIFVEENNVKINVTISYWNGPKNFISVTGILIEYYDSSNSTFISIDAQPNILTVDWDNLYDELYQPNMGADVLYELMLELKVSDIQRLFSINDIEY